MSRVVFAVNNVILSFVFLLPLCLIYEKYLFHNIRRMFMYMVFSAYLVAVYSLVGLPNILYIRMDFTYNFVPFADMISDFTNEILNIALFIPLGGLLPVLCERYRKIYHTVLFGIGTSFIIELLQVFTYRTTDINDIITNTVGTMLGYLFVKCITKGFSQLVLKNKKVNEVYIVCVTVAFVMFVLHPLIRLVIKC